jgi:4-O-beta-D-mannosyl-D-glucose phosphorylase
MFKNETFHERKARLKAAYEAFVSKENEVETGWDNGVYLRCKNPVLTHAHTPLEWRYDFNEERNPFLMERMEMNAICNSGAIELNGKICLVARMEGVDRKSYFGICESDTGIDNFRFHEIPCVIPETERPDTNVYDMRLVQHEDGWIYGLFCTERKDPNAPEHNTSAAEAQCGIVRTKDLRKWERLPDLKSPSPQQRNVVLHPEFVDGKYMLYTRPQDGFIDTGSGGGTGGGIGYGFCDDMTNAVVPEEKIMDYRIYHTIKEVKNGQGPAPIKTEKGWLHLAHGVRGTASGLRYTLYMFMTDLKEPWKVIHAPGGHFIAPCWEEERIGDLISVAFTNGWVAKADGSVYIYYASCDTRMHVAYSTIDRLVDYCVNTPEDGLRSAACVQQRIALIEGNKE